MTNLLFDEMTSLLKNWPDLTWYELNKLIVSNYSLHNLETSLAPSQGPNIDHSQGPILRLDDKWMIQQQIDMMTNWWNDQLMKCPIDEMTNWWNDQLMNWNIDEMTRWNDKLMKWHVDEMTRWWNDTLMKWQVDEMTRRNDKLMKWLVNEKTSLQKWSFVERHVDEVTNWWNDKLI
jgi:hypothetical protein